MSWQDAVVALIVAGAVAYLGWKIFFRSRAAKKPPKKGPDVPTDRLVRRK